MPILTCPTLTRRAFNLALAGAGVSVLRSQEAEMHWALLSDTHVPGDPAGGYRGFRPQETLQRAVPGVLAAKPQGVLICGDVAREFGLQGDYDAVKTILKPVLDNLPTAIALGNHDDRANFLAALGATQQGVQKVPKRHVLAVEGGAVRFLVLDSLMQPKTVAGLLGRDQRTWLSTYLKSASAIPTVLFVHHTLDDGDSSLLDAPRLFELLRPHRNVKAIVFGHSHRYGYDTWEGVHLINLPALGYNFTDDQPVAWVDARFTREGGSFTLRALAGNTKTDGAVTRLSWRT